MVDKANFWLEKNTFPKRSLSSMLLSSLGSVLSFFLDSLQFGIGGGKL